MGGMCVWDQSVLKIIKIEQATVQIFLRGLYKLGEGYLFGIGVCERSLKYSEAFPCVNSSPVMLSCLAG